MSSLLARFSWNVLSNINVQKKVKKGHTSHLEPEVLAPKEEDLRPPSSLKACRILKDLTWDQTRPGVPSGTVADFGCVWLVGQLTKYLDSLAMCGACLQLCFTSCLITFSLFV